MPATQDKNDKTISNDIFLCSISNVLSGNCSEDCAYCTQSAHFKTNIEVYDFKPLESVLEEARYMSRAGALGFCLVTSGLALDTDEFGNSTDVKIEYVARAARAIRAENLPLHLIACNGKASYEALAYLKAAGIDSYNHNLETSREYFPKMCTTHSFDDRIRTNENALEAGLGLLCGGIFGLGESMGDRISLMEDIARFAPHTMPINFYIPNPALSLGDEVISREEALECITLAREYLPSSRLMLAGGRELVFGANERDMFAAGINGIVLGNYLTTKGKSPSEDVEMIERYGYSVAKVCHE